MDINNLTITCGSNSFQEASINKNDKTIDYTTSQNLTYSDILSIAKGLNVISEFFDVNAVVTVAENKLCAVSLGRTLYETLHSVIDTNPVEFTNAIVIASAEVDSDFAKMLRDTNKIVAPKFTQNAKEMLDKQNICYVTINTPLKDYKKYISNEVQVTPLGTLSQTPNMAELTADKFKIVSKTKPTAEQIEDAVFAWKIAKHANSRAIVIAKDLKTTAISQGLQEASVEFALNYSCENSKDAILASDMPLNIHDINAAAQGRIGLIILPKASPDVINLADKYNIVMITTGFTNILL